LEGPGVPGSGRLIRNTLVAPCIDSRRDFTIRRCTICLSARGADRGSGVESNRYGPGGALSVGCRRSGRRSGSGGGWRAGAEQLRDGPSVGEGRTLLRRCGGLRGERGRGPLRWRWCQYILYIAARGWCAPRRKRTLCRLPNHHHNIENAPTTYSTLQVRGYSAPLTTRSAAGAARGCSGCSAGGRCSGAPP